MPKRYTPGGVCWSKTSSQGLWLLLTKNVGEVVVFECPRLRLF